MQECTTIMMSTHDHKDDLINGSWRESVMMDNTCVTEEYLRLNANCSFVSLIADVRPR